MNSQINGLENLGRRFRRAQKRHLDKRLSIRRKGKFKNNRIDFLITVVFFIGIVFSILGLSLYEKTIINFMIPISIWLSSTFISTIATKEILTRYGDTNNIIIQAIFNSITWGGTTVFLFMALNTYLSLNETRIINTSILKSGYLRGKKGRCERPYINIKVWDLEKTMKFPCGLKVENYSSVTLTVRRGLFGFDTIVNQSLEK